MKIALLGPIATAGIAPFVDLPPPEGFPVGYGGAPFMNTLIAELLARGHEVCAITCGGYEAQRDSKPLCLKGERFTYVCCPSRKHTLRPSAGRVGRIVDFFAYEREHLAAELAACKPDFVHAHWTYEFALVAMDSGFPYLVTAHDDPAAVFNLNRSIYRLGRYFMARRVFGKVNAMTAVSGDLKSRIQGYVHCDVDVVPNPLSRQFIDAGARCGKRALGAGPKIISVNNGWGYWKNVSNALRAFARVRKALPDVTYHLYGVGYEPDGEGCRWAKANGLLDGATFHGPVPHVDLIAAMQGSAMMLHVSRWEACPMGIAEAMALGLPVVGGNRSGGVPWIIGEAGLLVDIDRPEDIAASVMKLLTDKTVYAVCVDAALARVKAFDPTLIALQYEQKYQQVLGRDCCHAAD